MNIKNIFKKTVNNKSIVQIALILVLWSALVFVTLNHYKNTLGKEFVGNESYENQVEIYQGVELTQIVNAFDNTESISFKIAGYKRNNSGELSVLVTNLNKTKIYADKNINVKKLQDNMYYTVGLNTVLNNGDDILITITSTSECGKGVGVYYSANDYFINNECKINGETVEGDLTLKLILSSPELKEFSTIVISISIVCLSILLILLFATNLKQEYIFTAMVLVFGLIFMLIIIPGSPPDEIHHYEIATSLSNKILGKDTSIVNNTYVDYDSFASHTNSGYFYSRFIRDIGEKLELSKEYVSLNAKIDDNYAIYYVPQAIGITIARLFSCNMLKTFYAARLVNLLFYCLCVFIAIKKTPIHKVMMGLLACLPLFIQQAASISYDCFINGLVFIIIAYLFKWKYQEERITIKEYIFVLIVNLILSPAKVVYGLFIFLYWFIPKEKFGGFKNKVIGLLLLSGYTIYLVVYNIFIRVESILSNLFTVKAFDLLNDKFDKIEEVNREERAWKLKYFFSYPKETLFIYLKTIRYSIKKWFYEAIGSALSGLTLELPKFIFYTFIGLILVSSFRKEDFQISIVMKISFIVVCVVIAMIVLTLMLTGWLTPIDGMIQGVQGRYFSPLLPFFFSIFGNKKITISKKIDKYLILTEIFMMFETIVYVLSFTFIN